MNKNLKTLILILSVAALFTVGNSADCLFKKYLDNANACTDCNTQASNCVACTGDTDCSKCDPSYLPT